MKELLEKILGQIKKTPSGVRAYEDLYHICLETQKTDIPLSVEYLKKLSDIIENRIPQSETDKELRSLFMLHKKVLLAAAPFDFESYLLYVEWEREPDKKFYVPRREVMHPVVQAMQDLIDDRLDLLTISMPPGTGKSTLGIFFLSWVMGRFPDSQSLASAHSGMLTRSFYDGVYQIITDSEYLWADVFPGVKMAATNSKEETIDLHKKHRFSTAKRRSFAKRGSIKKCGYRVCISMTQFLVCLRFFVLSPKRERKPNLMLRKHIPSIKRRWRKQNSRRKRLSLKRVCAICKRIWYRQISSYKKGSEFYAYYNRTTRIGSSVEFHLGCRWYRRSFRFFVQTQKCS